MYEKSTRAVCNNIDRSSSSYSIWISMLAMIIPQTVYANKDEGNPSSSTDDCKSDQLPAGIDGKISCMGQGECYSEDFEVDGKEVRHCNFMMSTK
jgi:hypothetical protein